MTEERVPYAGHMPAESTGYCRNPAHDCLVERLTRQGQEIAELKTSLAAVTAERDKAREWARAWKNAAQAGPIPDSDLKDLSQQVMLYENTLREVVEENDSLRQTLEREKSKLRTMGEGTA